MRFLCIGDRDTARGFQLAGVQSFVIEDARAAEEVFAAAMERRDCGVIVIARGVADLIRAQVDQAKQERTQPLIAEIDVRVELRGG